MLFVYFHKSWFIIVFQQDVYIKEWEIRRGEVDRIWKFGGIIVPAPTLNLQPQTSRGRKVKKIKKFEALSDEQEERGR